MALYAIGDLHLSMRSNKPMDIFGERWINHVDKIENNWKNTVTEDDTILLAGDHSWGKDLEESMKDLEFIEELPGRKILLRGNHDRFWDAKRTRKLNQKFSGRLFFLQNNYFTYEDYALVGTKGYYDEGMDTPEQLEKLLHREAERLRVSFEAAKKDGYKKYLMFLHYPPTCSYEKTSRFTELAEEYGAEKVVYAHCHGDARFYNSIHGEMNGIMYQLVSSDFVDFTPVRIR